jgi:hypothetical protein
LFLKDNERDEEKREDLYRMLVGLFIPWGRSAIDKPVEMKLEAYIEGKKEDMPPRLQRCVDNLGLLHKTAKEIEQDLLQRKASGVRGNVEGVIREELENSFLDYWSVDTSEYGLDDLRLPPSEDKDTRAVMVGFSTDFIERDAQELEDADVFCDLHESEVFRKPVASLSIDDETTFRGIS